MRKSVFGPGFGLTLAVMNLVLLLSSITINLAVAAPLPNPNDSGWLMGEYLSLGLFLRFL